MKTWHPDDGEGSDPFLGGFVSRRAEMLIGLAGLALFCAAWWAFGLSVAAGAAVVVVLVWTMLVG